MKFQLDVFSIPIDKFDEHWVLAYYLTSMKDNTENSHYLKVLGVPLKLELNFFPEQLTGFTTLGKRLSSVALGVYR